MNSDIKWDRIYGTSTVIYVKYGPYTGEIHRSEYVYTWFLFRNLDFVARGGYQHSVASKADFENLLNTIKKFINQDIRRQIDKEADDILSDTSM